MIFLQLFDPESSTFTYLLGDPQTREAVLIDPVRDQVDRDVTLLQRLGLRLVYTLETHVHADHVSGGGLLRERLGSRTVVHESGGASCADLKAADDQTIEVGSMLIEVLHTPGHTDGDVSYRVGDRVFTGDALLIGGCGRTDFQQGDAGRLYDSIHNKLFRLPDETLVFPGHDYKGNVASTIGWEKRHNARLGGGRSREDFIALMNDLHLPPPKKIQEAVPANLRCGLPEPDFEALSTADPRGFRELVPEKAVPLLDRFKVVDVREPHELVGPLGHIDVAEAIPLGAFPGPVACWDKTTPILLVCRSGARSGQAAEVLTRAGFTRAFNLAGGMIAWNDAKLPVVDAGKGA